MTITKADAKVKWEEADKPESFTHFELLRIQVDVLKEQVEEIVAILNYNDIDRQKTIEAEYFDDDKVFQRLAEMAE